MAKNALISNRIPGHNSLAAYGLAVAGVAVAIAVLLAVGSSVEGLSPFAALFPAIILAALMGGTGPGITAVVLGGFAAWYFFFLPAPPQGAATASEAFSLLFYLVSGMLILIVVADRRSSEASLRRERDRAKLYFETAGVMLLVLRDDRRVCLINRCGAEILAASAGEIIGKDWVETFIPPRLRAAAAEDLERCLQGNEHAEPCTEGVVLRADGAERVIAWRHTRLPDEQGRIIGILSSGEDVTDQRRAEQALRESEARFRVLAESMPQLVWSTLPDGYCDYLSRQWVEYTGLPETQHHGFGWLHAVHADDRPAIAACWGAAIRGYADYDVKYRLRGGDGAYRWFAARGSALRDERGRVVRWVGTSTDITGIVQAGEELEERVAERTRELEEVSRRLVDEATERAKAEAALARVQRLEAIGQLTGGVAHDFNNLLTVIVGNLEMIQRRAEDPARVRRLAVAALGAAERGETVTRQLLAFSRQQALKPELVELNGLIRAFEPIARRATGDAATLRLAINPDDLYCRVDPAQFETAILNLLVNARDATGPGGNIVVETLDRRIDPAGPGEQPDLPRLDYVLVVVRDDGCGIAANVLPRVFDPFFTTKDVGKGSGLGLSQVYGFVRQSGGNMRIESQPGLGTTVRIYLPRAEKPAPSREAPPITDEERPAAAESEVVLVVEDDAEVLEIALEMLRGLNYLVLVARDGLAALEVLRGSERVDLLFSDIVMPRGMNGAELARRARALRPGMPILLTSGYTARALSQDHGVADEFPLLRKPYRLPDLASAVQSLLPPRNRATADRSEMPLATAPRSTAREKLGTFVRS